MENKEMEMKKLDTEELDPVAGGRIDNTPAGIAFHDYARELREKYNIPQGQRICVGDVTQEEWKNLNNLCDKAIDAESIADFNERMKEYEERKRKK